MATSTVKGWHWPRHAKAPHYFVCARSLCGEFVLRGEAATVEREDTNVVSPEDCEGCAVRLLEFERAELAAARRRRRRRERRAKRE